MSNEGQMENHCKFYDVIPSNIYKRPLPSIPWELTCTQSPQKKMTDAFKLCISAFFWVSHKHMSKHTHAHTQQPPTRAPIGVTGGGQLEEKWLKLKVSSLCRENLTVERRERGFVADHRLSLG